MRFLLIAFTLLSFGPSSARAETTRAAKNQPLVFKTLEEALKSAKVDKRVVVAHFTAKWCGYCRKMETDTYTDPQVLAVAKKFVWAKVDIDTEPITATRFNIRGVPAIILFNVRGEVLSARSGYLPASAMARLLQENVDNAEAPGQAQRDEERIRATFQRLKDAASDGELEKAVADVVLILAAPERERRQEARKQLLDLKRRVWPGLVACLSHRRLAVRAAAYDILTEGTRVTLPFDAFADEATRATQAAAWQTWLFVSHRSESR